MRGAPRSRSGRALAIGSAVVVLTTAVSAGAQEAPGHVDRFAVALNVGGLDAPLLGGTIDWIRTLGVGGVGAGLEGVTVNGSSWLAGRAAGYLILNERLSLIADGALGRGQFSGTPSVVHRAGTSAQLVVSPDRVVLDAGVRDYAMGTVRGTLLQGRAAVDLRPGLALSVGWGEPLRGGLAGRYGMLRVDRSGPALSGFAGVVVGGVRPELLTFNTEPVRTATALELFGGVRRHGPVELGTALSVRRVGDTTQLTLTLMSVGVLP